MTKLITRNYETVLPKLPAAFDGVRIAFLSDLHGCCYGDGNGKLLAAVEEIRPDYVFIGGDMLIGLPETGKWEKTRAKVAEDLVCRLAARYPVYYTDGNHEGKCPEREIGQYREKLRSAGVIFVNNTSVKIGRAGQSIVLHGLVLERCWYPKGKRVRYRTEDMVQKLHCHPAEDGDGKCHILMAHHPIYFKNYREWGADLVLSGHLHGGVARLPFVGGVLGPDFLPFPPYSGGQYREGEAQLIVSCGLGAHTIPFRFFNPPEVSVVMLRKT